MQKKLKPRITISASDHDRLLRLANAMEDRDPDLSDTLINELERARVVEDKTISDTVVRMGSTVSYTADEETHTVTLVYPGEADISQGRVSVTTPVGVALIGLSKDQTIDWVARNGRVHRLTIKKIHHSESV